MRKTYYLYKVISHPTADEEKADPKATSSIVKEGEFFASSQRNAELQIIKELSEENFARLETNGLEILLRPF